MNWTKKFNKSTWSSLYALSCFTIVALVLWFAASTNPVVKAGSDKASPEGTTIAGTGTGAIPDGGPGCGPLGTPLVISFDASGVSGTLSNVSVDFTATHSWVGDLDAKLIAPDATEHILFTDTGWDGVNSTCGTNSDLGGLYSFDDSASGDWWATAAGAPVMAPGSFRTVEAGGSATGGTATAMNTAFAGANPTGTWMLEIIDGGAGDTGSISAANLTLTTGMVAPADSGNPDFDGDNRTDYSTVRNTVGTLHGGTPPGARRSIEEMVREPGFKALPGATGNNLGATPGTGLSWFISNSMSGSAGVTDYGNPTTDFWVPEDYDGDGQDDIAVWRGLLAAGPAGGYFHIFNSSNSTTTSVDFGILGDNPTVAGDYDGDQMADPAVYRCPPNPGGQCTFFFLGSNNNPGNNITYFDWGNNSVNASRPYPGDFDGDGMKDFCVFNNGTYTLRRSSDGGVEYISWGLGSDPVIVPGDYDGDGSTDFMNIQLSGTTVLWWLLERDGAQSVTAWGALVAGFAEFVTPGDYDGDGSTDIAIWRRNNGGPAGSFFYVLRSSDGMLGTFEWGSMADAPIPGWNGN